jgi:hypothetical protein
MPDQQMATALEADEFRAGNPAGRVLRCREGAEAVVTRADHQRWHTNRLKHIWAETLAQPRVVAQPGGAYGDRQDAIGQILDAGTLFGQNSAQNRLPLMMKSSHTC